MVPILPRFVKHRHAWTSDRRIPWRTEEEFPGAVHRSGKGRDLLHLKLLRILSGRRWFNAGPSTAEEIAARKQTAFFVLAAVLAGLWILFFFVPPA